MENLKGIEEDHPQKNDTSNGAERTAKLLDELIILQTESPAKLIAMIN